MRILGAFLVAALLVLAAQGRQTESKLAKQARVNGATLHYVEAGQGEPVVFVHGTLSDYRLFAAQREGLGSHYRVLTYSRRYHWPNPWPADGKAYSYQLHAADLVALIDELKLGRVHLIGHSYGGFVAALVARDHPQLLRSVILVEPGIYHFVPNDAQGRAFYEQQKALGEQLPALLNSADDRALVRTIVESVVRPAQFDELLPDWQAIFVQNARSFRAQATAGVAPPPFTCQDAQKIRLPTLLLNGENTLAEYRLINDALERCIPGARRVTIPGASHGLPFEAPDAFNQAVLEFLRGN